VKVEMLEAYPRFREFRVSLPDGNAHNIALTQDGDPLKKVDSFCRRHGLDPLVLLAEMVRAEKQAA